MGRVDLGGLFVPGVDAWSCGRVAGDAIVPATVVLKGQRRPAAAFAAPARGHLGRVREEIASASAQQGGIVDEVEGPLGWELPRRYRCTAGRHGGFQVVGSSAWTARAGSCAG